MMTASYVPRQKSAFPYHSRKDGAIMREWTREEKYRYLKDPNELRELYRKNSDSVYRQHFHVQAVTGLINDPNGFVRFDGRWHLFYQWCPWGAVHGLKYWYHVVSEDLVTWENLGVFLCPEEEYGYDNKGAYSGSALPVDDKLYLYYTGNNRDEKWVRHAYTCLACLGPDGRAEKALLPLFGPHPDYTEHQRDPKIIVNPERGCCYLLLGAQTRDKRGCILVYRSADPLQGWSFAGELQVPGFENFGDMWECPSIEHIGGKDVLIFCPQHLELPGRGGSKNHNVYILGTMDWDTLTFRPDGPYRVLDFGFDSYAAACAGNIGDDGKAVLIAWMGLPDVSYPTDEEEWSGCLTLPRELTVRDGKLIQRPIPELAKLREYEPEQAENSFGCIALPAAAEMEIDVPGGSLELSLFCGEEGDGGMTVSYDVSARELTIDRSGMRTQFNRDEGPNRSIILENDLSQLRIFIDSSSVEVFVNDGEAVFTSRIFPTAGERFFRVKEGSASVKLYALKPAVKDSFCV